MDARYFDVKNEPFNLYGFCRDHTEKGFRRLPDAVAASISDNVAFFGRHTAGGRVRFKTDSTFISIKPKMSSVTLFPHMALTGSACFDLYAGGENGSTFGQVFKPPQDYYGRTALPFQESYVSTVTFGDTAMRDITINFPLYNEVDELMIGIEPSAGLETGNSYKLKKPILFYGSSITQGACATRPGSCFTAIISRRLDCDHINLGFSGSALGEDSMVDYIASLDISLFVCDYDHNAPDIKHLEATHGRLYERYRERKPDVPILFISKPDFDADKILNAERRAVIHETFMNAIRNGDKHVHFIDGETLFGKADRDGCTVDCIHPNDLGFMRMADTIEKEIRKIPLQTHRLSENSEESVC